MAQRSINGRFPIRQSPLLVHLQRSPETEYRRPRYSVLNPLVERRVEGEKHSREDGQEEAVLVLEEADRRVQDEGDD